MSYSKEILSQFDRYSTGQMSESEKQTFEASLKDDLALQKSFDEFLHLKDGLVEFGYSQMSDQIAGWESEISSLEGGKVISLKRWYMIAATISVILVAAISWWRLSPPESAENLYISYYEPYPDILTSRGSGEKLLNEGLYSYESGDYKESIGYLKNYLVTNKEHKEVLFYLGQAYLANDEPVNALRIFKDLEQENKFTLKEANQWYLALTHLKLKDTSSVNETLQQIIGDTNHAYRERSEKLIKKLN